MIRGHALLLLISCTIGISKGAYFHKENYEECMMKLSPSDEYDGIRKCSIDDFAIGSNAKRLGKGTYSTVILAVEEGTDQEVAIKTIHNLDDPRNFMAFKREACFLSSWSNAQTLIPQFHCIFYPLLIEEGSRPMASIVMEYIKGPTLLQIIEQKDRMEGDLLVPSVLQYIGTTIDLLHTNTLLHRDIKPDNIIIEEATGIPRLVDFGSCGFEAVLDFPMFALGHLSPELLRQVMRTPDGNFLDWRGMKGADWYAFGVTVYITSTGKYPIPDDLVSDAKIKLYILCGIDGRKFFDGMQHEVLYKGLMSKNVNLRWTFDQISKYLLID